MNTPALTRAVREDGTSDVGEWQGATLNRDGSGFRLLSLPVSHSHSHSRSGISRKIPEWDALSVSAHGTEALIESGREAGYQQDLTVDNINRTSLECKSDFSLMFHGKVIPRRTFVLPSDHVLALRCQGVVFLSWVVGTHMGRGGYS